MYRKSLFSSNLKKLLCQMSDQKSDYCVNVLLAIDAAYLTGRIDAEQLFKITMLDYEVKDGNVFISYIPVNKTPFYTKDGNWAQKNRQTGKLGKTMLLLIKNYCTLTKLSIPSSQVLEQFVNRFKSNLLFDNYVFKIVKGDDIAFYYDESNYYRTTNGGYTLFNSCMRFNTCKTFFDVYTKNQSCEMLIMFDKTLSLEKIVGRAIIWSQNNKKYVDRRFYCIDYYEQAMVEFIKKSKWSYKATNTYDDLLGKVFYEYDETLNDYKLNENCQIITTVDIDPKLYPYVDTLKFYEPETKRLTNDEFILGDYLMLNHEDGSAENIEHLVYCLRCGKLLQESDACWVNGRYYCKECADSDEFVIL